MKLYYIFFSLLITSLFSCRKPVTYKGTVIMLSTFSENDVLVKSIGKNGYDTIFMAQKSDFQSFAVGEKVTCNCYGNSYGTCSIK